MRFGPPLTPAATADADAVRATSSQSGRAASAQSATHSSSPGSYFRDIDRQEIGFMLDTGPAVPTAEKTRAGRFSPFPCVFRLYCQNHRILPRQRPANVHNLL